MIKRFITSVLCLAFIFSNFPDVHSQDFTVNPLGLTPLALKGLIVHPENVLKFDFLMDTGRNDLRGNDFSDEALKIMKYFLTDLAISRDDRWVQKQLGTVPISDTPYKARIVPGQVVVWENEGKVIIIKSRLRVVSSDRSIVLSALEKEVNEGKDFAQLRQMYQAIILATWYKKFLRKKEGDAGNINTGGFAKALLVWGDDLTPVQQEDVKKAADDVVGETVVVKGQVDASGMAQSNRALISWMRYNVYPEYGIPKSFEVPKDPGEAKKFWHTIGDDANGIPGFMVDEFSDVLPASGLVKAINKSGIVVPEGNNDIDSLNKLLKIKDLRNKLLSLKLSRQAADLLRGIIPKRMFFKVDWNGMRIIDLLVKKGVLEEVSPGAVRLKTSKDSLVRPQEIAGSNFDDIWTMLQLSRDYQLELMERTENKRMLLNRLLLEKVYPWQCPVYGITGIIERTIINDGLSIYEGAVWQAALAMAGGQYNFKAIDRYTDMLNSDTFGEFRTLRAWDKPYTYQGKVLTNKNSYFFRLISPRYLEHDPLTGADVKLGFPEYDRIHWVDWMPILGENSWVIIGLLQVAYAKGGGIIDPDSKEVKLAESIVPAIKALRTKIGAVFYTAKGTWNRNPGTISMENNTSLHAALMMLYAVTKNPEYLEIARGIESFLKNYCYDKVGHRIYQGGVYMNGQFIPEKTHFAEDCQSWGILAFSPAKIDEWLGDGEAYKIWESTKKNTGFYENGRISGVGFTNGHELHSAEWTWGAIGATNELALYYQKSHPDWARECLADSISMLKGQEELRHFDRDGHKSYLYANKRYFIPWGWWANSVPNLASTGWAYLIQNGYDPFRLGEKTHWFALPGLQSAVKKYQGVWPRGRAIKPKIISIEPVDLSALLGLKKEELLAKV